MHFDDNDMVYAENPANLMIISHYSKAENDEFITKLLIGITCSHCTTYILGSLLY